MSVVKERQDSVFNGQEDIEILDTTLAVSIDIKYTFCF